MLGSSEMDAIVTCRANASFGGGPNLRFGTADHWCPSSVSDTMFGSRKGAERLTGIPYLREEKKLTGEGVNVVIVDHGLDKDALGDSYAEGWPVGKKAPGSTKPEPGSAQRTHGMMIANNVLQVAPDAKLFDLPLIPPRITHISDFFDVACPAYDRMLKDIAAYQRSDTQHVPWVVVNAWAVFDRKFETPLQGVTVGSSINKYTGNPDHPFNRLIVKAVEEQEIDVVFCAGNGGQFCPDNRCGALDQGPGRSIFGANSLSQVLTVGAVRNDTLWLGSSSQGPGQASLGQRKPDLCTPSQFCEAGDAFATNGGTSAACALAAGVVAALRSNSAWAPDQVSPAELKEVLNKTARQTIGSGWNGRTGHGILDAHAAYDELERRYP
jgi:hypothetical protein